MRPPRHGDDVEYFAAVILLTILQCDETLLALQGVGPWFCGKSAD